MSLINLLQQILNLEDILLHEVEAITYSTLCQPLQDHINTPAHIFLFAGLLRPSEFQLAVYPYFHGFLLVELVPFGLRAEEDHRFFDPEGAVLFREVAEGIDQRAAKAFSRSVFLLVQILSELLVLVLYEHLVAVHFAGAASLGILAEVDQLDDVGVVDVGPAHELRVAGDHFLFGGVVEAVLIDEFLGDGVAIGVVIEFEPILDHEAGFLLETVAH